MYILKNNKIIGRGTGDMPLSNGHVYAEETPELNAQYEQQLAELAAIPVPPAPFDISKYKLINNIDALGAGKEDAFFAFLNQPGNEKYLRRWDASQVLNTADPFVVQLLPVFNGILGVDDAVVQSLLETSRV